MLVGRYTTNNETTTIPPNEVFSITYRDAGGNAFSGTLGEDTPVTHSRGTDTVLVNPTKAGNQFLGWFLEFDVSGEARTYLGAYEFEDDITLYAKWQADANVLAINYSDVGGGIFSGMHGTGAPFVHRLGYQTDLISPTREGYTFFGWFLNEEGTGKPITYLSADSEFENEVNLYAKWQANIYSITYNANRPTDASNYVIGVMGITTHTFNVSSNLSANMFELSGWTFIGWNTSSDGSGTAFADAQEILNLSVLNNANVSLYAQWEANTFTITYNANQPSNASNTVTGTMNPSIHTFDTTSFLTVNAFQLTGFGFAGWNTEADGSGYSFVNLQDITNLTPTNNANINLFAQWAEGEFAITYLDVNGTAFSGSFTGAFPTTHQYGTETVLITPYRVGFSFLGWFLNASGTGTPIAVLGANQFDNDITLYALWEAEEFIINFDVAGGNSLPSQNVTFGQSFTLPTPTREGHSFNGWTHNENVFDSGTWNIASDITIIANWIAETYIITFNVNGGNTLPSDSQNVTFGQSFTLPIPTRTGHTFNGWTYNENPFASGIWNVANNVTLVATWTANTYNIHFDSNGGSSVSDMTVTFGENYLLPTPTRIGHTFDGWKNGSTLVPGSGLWNIAEDVVLVAEWIANTYIITFNVNGGNTLPSDSQNVTFGQSFTLPIPTRTGHTFNGWTYNENPFASGTWNIPNNITIVATWNANVYTITFDVNQGDALSSNTQTVTFNEAYTLPTPTRSGYEFIGWHYNESYVALSGLAWNISGDITLIAQWSYEIFLITFDVDGGNMLPSNTQTVGFGVNYTLPIPTRTGHTFDGWFHQSTRIATSGIWNIAADVTLTAHWIANDYIITFDTDGGNTLSDMTVTFGQNYTLPTPTKTGHTFLGWMHNDGIISFEGVWLIANDITLTAYWEANTYTITFSFDDGYSAPAAITVTFGQSFTLPEPTRTGFEFGAWHRDGVGFPSSGIWDIANDVSLVGTWIAMNFTITFVLTTDATMTESHTMLVTFGETYSLPIATLTGHTFNGWEREDSGLLSLTGIWNIASDITLTSVFSANEYIITLDVNGGNTLPANTQTVTFGQNYTLPVPTRTGHTFNGWYNGKDLMPLTGTWDIANDVTLVASWTANTYTITFDVNGGENLDPNTQNITFGESYTLPEPTRNGFTFLGWFNGLDLIDLTGIWAISENITLRAEWESQSFFVNFDVNGGTPIESIIVTFGETYLLPTPVRTGHTFVGWFDGTTQIAISGTWGIGDHVTVRAEWTANTYTVNFNTNGGNTITPLTVTFSQSFTLPIPTREGHTFNGWLHNENPFNSTGTWNIDSDITLIASWTADTYTINFDTNGGDALSAMLVTFGQSYTLPTPTRIGHTFLGWELSGAIIPQEGDSWYRIPREQDDGNFLMFARWQANSYTISFESNDGNIIVPITVTFGQSYTLPIPTRTGHTFNGWQHNETNIPLSGTSWNIAENVTLVAQWTANTYTVELWHQVPFGSATLFDTITVTFGQSFILPDLAPVVLADGSVWILHEWVRTDDGSLAAFPFIGTWNIDSNVSLLSEFELFSVRVAFDADGGSDHAAVTILMGATYFLPTPIKTGHTFEGWFHGTTLVSQSGTWTIAQSVTLVASWTAQTFTVTFNSDGGNVIDSQNVIFGQNYTLPTPIRTGHTFTGWHHVIMHQQTLIPTSGVWDFVPPSGISVNLIAFWTANTYTVEFWREVRHGLQTHFDTVTVTFGEVFSFEEPSNVMLADGSLWRFRELVRTDDGSLANFPLTGTWNIDSDVTLFAEFNLYSVLVLFNSNGGNEIAAINFVIGATYTLPTPERTGHSFDGWFHGSTLVSQSGTWSIDSSITLNAQWSANTYTLELWDQLNIESPWVLIDTITVTFGQSFTLPTPIREGYTFSHWRHSTDALITLPQSGIWNRDYNFQARAEWSANTYTITFDSNGGNLLSNHIVTFGQSFTLPSPIKTGHTFAGWYYNDSVVSLTGTWNIATDVTLVASWTANTYTIAFDTTFSFFQQGSITVTFGQTYNLPNPWDVLSGFTFNGWYYGTDLIPLTGIWNIAMDVTLTASWTANTFTITFDGSISGMNFESITVTYSQPFSLPMINWSQGSVRFDAWYFNNERLPLTGEWSIANNVTLVASFIPEIEFVSVVSGLNYSIAIDTEGRLWSWGSNQNGQTGLGTIAGTTHVPTLIDTEMARFQKVTMDSGATIAIDTEGRLWSWGFNQNGQTGQGVTTGSTLNPTMINTGTTTFQFIVSEHNFTVAIDTEGRLWSWGLNQIGRTGQGITTGHTTVPTMINSVTATFQMASITDRAVVALDTQGHLWSWGANISGQTGLGTTEGSTLNPTMINTGMSRFSYIASDWRFTIAISTLGHLWSFGTNALGRTGLGITSGDTLTPTQITTGTIFSSLAVSNSNNIAIDSEGRLWSWGSNGDGRTGQGTTTGSTSVPTPIETGAIRFNSVHVMGTFSIAIDSEGRLWSWGQNADGRNGQGIETMSSTVIPTLINTGNARFTFISLSTMHGAAIDTNGHLWSWGSNVNGRTGQGMMIENTLIPTRLLRFEKDRFEQAFAELLPIYKIERGFGTTYDVTRILTTPGATVTWTTSRPDILNINTLELNLPTTEWINIDLIASVTIGSETRTKTFTVPVMPIIEHDSVWFINVNGGETFSIIGNSIRYYNRWDEVQWETTWYRDVNGDIIFVINDDYSNNFFITLENNYLVFWEIGFQNQWLEQFRQDLTEQPVSGTGV